MVVMNLPTRTLGAALASALLLCSVAPRLSAQCCEAHSSVAAPALNPAEVVSGGGATPKSGSGSGGGAPATGGVGGAPTRGGGITSSPGVGTGFGRRIGLSLEVRRHDESRRLLAVKWDYPAVLEPRTANDGPTQSEARLVALSREEALAKLTEKDRRPLVVLRECERCKGSDHALLSKSLDNERLQLLLNFFHCVKLRPNAIEAQHPFRKLFDAEKPAHLAILSRDGALSFGFDGNQTPAELEKALLAVLEAQGERGAAKTASELLKMLDRYDLLDAERKDAQEKLEAEIESSGPTTPRAKGFRQKFEAARKQIEELRLREAKLLAGSAKKG